jgi:hypothetical protein
MEQFKYYESLGDKRVYCPLAGLSVNGFPLKLDYNKNKKIRLGFVARLYPDKVKGEDLLFEIASQLSPDQFEFVIRCDKSDNRKSVLIRNIQKLGFDISVDTEIDVLLICSKYEGTPLPLIEALASGTCVLSTNVGESPEVLSKENICKTSKDFVNRIKQIEQNRDQLKHFVENGYKLVSNRTWEIFFEKSRYLWTDITSQQEKKMIKKVQLNYISEKRIRKDNKKRVFIVAGGPSVNTIDLNKLKDEDVICVNRSIELFDKPKYFVTMDYTFFGKINDHELNIISKAQYSCFVLNVTNSKIFEEINGVITDIRRNVQYQHLEKFDYIIPSKNLSPFGNTYNQFAHGDNSGFCAIQLALMEGYEEINLIGFDLGFPHEKTHYHDGYATATNFRRQLNRYRQHYANGFNCLDTTSQINTLTPTPLEQFIPLVTFDKLMIKQKPMQKNLMIVGYYTKDTIYQEEAKKLVQSLNKLNLRYDIVPIQDFGNWQENTRYKAQFMLDMLEKHNDHNLLYIDCDAIVHSKPELFTNDYDCDVAVRWQDFRWRQNECLSGTIYMANNQKTRELCKMWQQQNVNEGKNVNTFEQWNLGKAIVEMRSEGLKDQNLPPEYTMIFDSMRAMYPNVKPVIEHFQASRRTRRKSS